ncbi:MAG: hypothetical protein OXG15_01045 [Gammaproteobacteria bacterium]|nr:hypothetical protein [Gammaproteobacteria bacterium]
MNPETTISVTRLRREIHSLLDNLPPEGLIITNRGRPVAQILPCHMKPEDMIGRLKGEFEIHGDIYSTGITWEATKDPNE